MIEDRDIFNPLFASLLLLAVFVASERAVSAQPVENQALRQELLAILAKDQALEQEIIEHIKHGLVNLDSAFVARQDSLFDLHARRLIEIVEQHGWPTSRTVGPAGTSAAFTLLQHADLGVQERMLPLVQEALERGEVPGYAVAMLVDRVRVRHGQPQLYGTQVGLKDGRMRVEPIADSASVDVRRAELGLPPLEEYLEELKRIYGVEQSNQ